MSIAAGRELDALVALHVMGWHHAGSSDRYPVDDKGQSQLYLPDYSTDIGAAWAVAEAISKAFQCGVSALVRFHAADHVRYRCSLSGGVVAYPTEQRTLWVDAPTAPLAICLAALRAVGYEVTP